MKTTDILKLLVEFGLVFCFRPIPHFQSTPAVFSAPVVYAGLPYILLVLLLSLFK